MKASKSSQADLLALWLESLPPGIRLGLLLLPDSERQRAFDLYKTRCASITAERLALEAFHAHHPLEVMSKAEECVIRDITDKPLAGMKERGEVPYVMPPVS